MVIHSKKVDTPQNHDDDNSNSLEMFEGIEMEAPVIEESSTLGRDRIENNIPKKLLPQYRQLKDFLHNPAAGFIGGVAATIFMTFVGINLSRPGIAEPAFAINSQRIIASEFGNLEIIWNGDKVPNAGIVEVTVWNDGNGFIDGKSFVGEGPIEVREMVGIEGLDILEVKIEKVSRDSLEFRTEIVLDEHGREMVRLSFNREDALESNDGATVRILYSAESTNDLCSCSWYVKSRIKGYPEGFIHASQSAVPKTLKSDPFEI